MGDMGRRAKDYEGSTGDNNMKDFHRARFGRNVLSLGSTTVVSCIPGNADT